MLTKAEHVVLGALDNEAIEITSPTRSRVSALR